MLNFCLWQTHEEQLTKLASEVKTLGDEKARLQAELSKLQTQLDGRVGTRQSTNRCDRQKERFSLPKGRVKCDDGSFK